MENDAVITYGLVVVVIAAIAGSFTVWKLVTSYADKKTGAVQGSVDKLTEQLNKLELTVAKDYPTNETVSKLVERLEASVDRLTNKLDEFSTAFNKSLLEFAKRPATANARYGRRKTRRKTRHKR